MRQRKSHIWDRDPLDWYVEPRWVSQRLFDREGFEGPIVDPCAGSGNIYKSAIRAGHKATAFDIKSRFPECKERDFFTDRVSYSNIVTNPPFHGSQEFVDLAIKRTLRKCALILPTVWLNGDARSRWLEKTPLARVLLITPRPSMPPGHVIEAGEKPGNGTKDYAWFIWDKQSRLPPRIGWLRRD